MKILIISYDFYPESKPNAHRWFNIAKKWAKDGAEVYVISANKNQFAAFEKVDGVNIYRTTEFLVGGFKYKFRKSFNDTIETNYGFLDYLKAFLKKILKKLYFYLWSCLYWPDHSFLWRFSAIPVATKLIRTYDIDNVISVSWTFTSHLIGYHLKRKYKNLHWIADTIDPFSFNININNNYLYNKVNKYYEHKIFKSADLNFVLTDKIKEKYISLYPLLKNKIEVNNNLFIPTDFNFVNDTEDLNVRILFLGTLSRSTRPPNNLLILVDNLVKKHPTINIKLDFYGDFTDTIQDFKDFPHLLNKYIFLFGYINKQQVNDAIKNTHILLNIGNNNEFQEPSKLIEYMYSRKIILNICNIIDDSSLGLLSRYPLHFNVMPSDLGNEEFLNSFYFFLKNSTTTDNKLSLDFLNDYLLESVADKYFSFLKKNIKS